MMRLILPTKCPLNLYVVYILRHITFCELTKVSVMSRMYTRTSGRYTQRMSVDAGNAIARVIVITGTDVL